MSYIQVPTEWLLSGKISATQFRLICVIKLTSRDFGDGMMSYLGFDKLAKGANLSRATVIREIKDLQNKGFLEVRQRANRSKSNGIELTLDKLQECLDEIEGSQNDTPEGCQNDTRGYQNDTPGYQNDTPHIDNRFKNINLKFKYMGQGCQNDTPKEMTTDSQLAPADIAAGRSMPNGGRAAESSAGNERGGIGAALAEERLLLVSMRAIFTDIFEDLSVSKAGNSYILRKKGKFALIEDVRLKEVADWMRAKGLDARVLDVNTRVMGETLIEEVA